MPRSSTFRREDIEEIPSSSIPQFSDSLHDSYPYQIPFSKTRRVILTKEHVLEIYKLRMTKIDTHKRNQSKSGLVAKFYGVSPKTIRDIWNRKTWTWATQRSSLSADNETGGSLAPSKV